jgi:hypothetical protein
MLPRAAPPLTPPRPGARHDEGVSGAGRQTSPARPLFPSRASPTVGSARPPLPPAPGVPSGPAGRPPCPGRTANRTVPEAVSRNSVSRPSPPPLALGWPPSPTTRSYVVPGTTGITSRWYAPAPPPPPPPWPPGDPAPPAPPAPQASTKTRVTPGGAVHVPEARYSRRPPTIPLGSTGPVTAATGPGVDTSGPGGPLGPRAPAGPAGPVAP